MLDATGRADAVIFGDVLCARAANKGVAAPVPDGVVRDLAGVLGTGLRAWCSGAVVGISLGLIRLLSVA